MAPRAFAFHWAVCLFTLRNSRLKLTSNILTAHSACRSVDFPVLLLASSSTSDSDFVLKRLGTGSLAVSKAVYRCPLTAYSLAQTTPFHGSKRWFRSPCPGSIAWICWTLAGCWWMPPSMLFHHGMGPNLQEKILEWAVKKPFWGCLHTFCFPLK